MTTTTQTTTVTGQGPVGGEHDAHRTALRDLVKLSADCAAAEIEIERTHRAQVQAANRQLETSLSEIEQRHDQLLQEAQQQYEQRVAQITAQHAAALAEQQNYESTTRSRFEYEHDAIENDLKNKLQQAIWLAESVFEATQNQIAKEYRKAKETHASQLEEADAMEKRLLELLALYGRRDLAESARAAAPAAASEASEPATAPPQTDAAAEPPSLPGGSYETHRDAVSHGLARLGGLAIPRLFVGMRPYLIVAGIMLLSGVASQMVAGGLPYLTYGQVQWQPLVIGYAIGGAAGVCLLAGGVLRLIGNAQVKRVYVPLRQSLDAARLAADAQLQDARAQRQIKTVRATKKRDMEIQAARDRFGPLLARAAKNRAAAMQSIQADSARRRAAIDHKRDQAMSQASAWLAEQQQQISQSRQRELSEARQRHQQALADSQQQYEQARTELQQRWTQGLDRIQRPIEQQAGAADEQHVLLDWDDPRWQVWSPPQTFPRRIRFGELHVDLRQITDQVPRELSLPPSFSVPAALSVPDHASLVIHTDHAGRVEAIRTLQMLMARLLTQFPPGRVRFTIIDPVGLGQNFAGFMRLADHDEALVTSRIWTETEHIEQQLANLTEHMETVIQKYLRNEFATIDEYNAQAGELAEPYRYLVVADFPVGFEGEALRRLNSIASSGARCGVFTLILRDTRKSLPGGAHLDEIESHSVNLVRKGDRFIWKDEIFRQFPLTLDPPPGEQLLMQILDEVGRRAKQAKRVEVPFSAIAPPPQKLWSSSSRDELQVPIGRLGATRLQYLRLGRGVAQHALIAGKTGSGKSTLLHVLVTNLALWYHPDEVEFYLVDFKKGVEFKTYATHALPHARAIAVESDREFGLSVLHRIDAELARRGEMFRRLGVQDIAAYRQASGQRLPRTLLIIDEFQEFFSEDDKLAQEAGLLLDRLVRQGRAFGIHVLLGSQTIGGTSGLARSTIGQMAVRIALQTSEADSQLILGDNNSAARLLSRPGEAIYNDAGGLVEGNSPFQISWLSEEERELHLDRVRQLAGQRDGNGKSEPIVFEGNAPADITKNKRLAQVIEHPPPAGVPTAPQAWLGEPVAIKDPTSIVLRRQAGANVLIVGQHEEGAMALMSSMILSLAAQHPRASARFYLLDGTPADSALAGVLPRITAAIPHDVRRVEWRGVADAMAELAEQMQQRQAAEHHLDLPSIYVFIYGLQRYRMLRKSEESFSFSMDTDAAEKKPQPDRIFADLLRDGPGLGIHLIAWCDTAASLDRTLDRGSMREFDHRVLFQMSAADSSNLIDSPNANKLGFHRALVYSEEQGVMEKFRPYALPPAPWLERVGSVLLSRG